MKLSEVKDINAAQKLRWKTKNMGLTASFCPNCRIYKAMR